MNTAQTIVAADGITYSFLDIQSISFPKARTHQSVDGVYWMDYIVTFEVNVDSFNSGLMDPKKTETVYGIYAMKESDARAYYVDLVTRWVSQHNQHYTPGGTRRMKQAPDFLEKRVESISKDWKQRGVEITPDKLAIRIGVDVEKINAVL